MDYGWSTRQGDVPEDPPASTYPSLGIGHILSCNVVPVDSPARLENHKTPISALLATTNSSTYSIHHSSFKSYDGEHIKSHEDTNTGSYIERILNTYAATAYAIKSARHNSIVQRFKTPSGPKKALADWKKQGKTGLPPQHMTISQPEVKVIRGTPQVCISCTLDEPYPNFHIQCILQYLDHKEHLGKDQKRLRLAFATVQTKENAWVIALEQHGTNEASMKEVLGDTEYARLGAVSPDGPDLGQPVESVTGLTRKLVIPSSPYNMAEMWCHADSFYQLNIYIPDTSA